MTCLKWLRTVTGGRNGEDLGPLRGSEEERAAHALPYPAGAQREAGFGAGEGTGGLPDARQDPGVGSTHLYRKTYRKGRGKVEGKLRLSDEE